MTAQVLPFRRLEPKLVPPKPRQTEGNEKCWLLRGMPPLFSRY